MPDPSTSEINAAPKYRADDPDGEVYNFVMLASYAGAVAWALRSTDVMDRFKAETGALIPATRGIYAMIDTACGVDRSFVAKFREWFNREVWGEAEPDGYWNDDAPGGPDV